MTRQGGRQNPNKSRWQWYPESHDAKEIGERVICRIENSGIT